MFVTLKTMTPFLPLKAYSLVRQEQLSNNIKIKNNIKYIQQHNT